MSSKWRRHPLSLSREVASLYPGEFVVGIMVADAALLPAPCRGGVVGIRGNDDGWPTHGGRGDVPSRF